MQSASPAPHQDDAPAAVLYRQHGPLIFARLLKQAHSCPSNGGVIVNSPNQVNSPLVGPTGMCQ